MDGRQGPEPEFVGRARHALVDGLLAVYDEVAARPEPRWVSIEAPSGWGKTRLARELYARLAAERQADPAYWPPSLLSGPDALDDVGARRKRVNPSVDHVAGSLPSFAWWGISCTSRNGVPSVALAEDIGVLEAHAPYLDDAWLRLPRTSRAAADIRAFGATVADEAAMEVAGAVVEGVLGAAVPGLGIVRWVAEWGWGKHRERSDRADRLRSEGTVAPDHSGAADAVVEMLVRLARPGLPAVLFVEDLHDADPLLVDVVERVVAANASVLVVTTGWPGHLEESEPVAAALARAGDRLVRVVADDPAPLPGPFPAAARLEPLPAGDLAHLLRFYYPLVEDDTADRLVTRFTNPLALELFCQIPRIRRRYRDRPLALTAEQVADLPSSIRDLYRALWEELPEDVREGLAIATLGIPAAVDPSTGRSLLWNVDVMADAVRALGLPGRGDVDDALDDAPTAYAWARVVTDTLRRFVEPDQLRIASDDLSMFLDDSEVEVVNRTVAARLGALFEGGAEVRPAEQEHAARLLLALHSEGFEVEPATVGRAVLALVELLRDDPGELDERLRLCDLALAADPPPDLAATLGLRRAQTLLRLDREESAIAQLEEVVPALTDQQGPDGRETLTAEAELAWLERSSDPQGALRRVEGVVARAATAFGATDRQTLDARNVLTGCLDSVGRLTDSLTETRQLLADRRAALGDRHPDTLLSFHNLAYSLRQVGRLREARAAGEEALRLRTEALGPTHGHTLQSRAELAWILDAEGDVQGALLLRLSLFDDAREFLGERHPTTLDAMDGLCDALTAVGRVTEAVALSRDLVTATDAVFGATSSRSRKVRTWHAHRVRASGETAEALGVVQEVADEAERVHGPTDRRSTGFRLLESEYLRGAGRSSEALSIAQRTRAVRDAARPRDPSLVTAADQEVARCLLGLSRHDEASVLLEEVLAATVTDRPDDVSAAAWVAAALAFPYYVDGRPEAAVALMDEWESRAEPSLGPLAEVVVALRIERAIAVRWSDAASGVSALRALDARLASDYPGLHTQRTRVRTHLGLAQRDAGDLSGSFTTLLRLVHDLATGKGWAHPDTLAAADELFDTHDATPDGGPLAQSVDEQITEVVERLADHLPTARDRLGASNGAYRKLLVNLSQFGGERWGLMIDHHEDAARTVLDDPTVDGVQRGATLVALAVSRIHNDDGPGALDACYRAMSELPAPRDATDLAQWCTVAGSTRSLLAIVHGAGLGEWESALTHRLEHLATLRGLDDVPADALESAWEGLASTVADSTLPEDNPLMQQARAVLAERP